MTDQNLEFCSNIFERIGNSSDLDIVELESLLNSINKNLENISTRISHHNQELKKELENIDSDCPTCQESSHSLHHLLNTVIENLDENPGFEVEILSEFLSFCNRNNIVVDIMKDAESDPLGINFKSEANSLNGIIEKSEEENHTLWLKICQKVRKAVVATLKSLPATNSKEQLKHSPFHFDFVQKHRIDLCKLLYNIYTFDMVLNIICRLRALQIEEKESSTKECSVTFSDKTSACIHRSIKILGKVTSAQICMMYDDLAVFRSICEDVNMVVKGMKRLLALYSQYLEVYLDVFLNYYKSIKVINIELSSDNSSGQFFTTTDLRNFCRIFYILHSWHKNACSITDMLNKEIFNEQSKNCVENTMLSDESREKEKFCPWNWKMKFQSFIPILKKVIPSYIQCVSNVVNEARKSEGSIQQTKVVHISENVCGWSESSAPVTVTTHCATLLSLLNEVIVFAIPDEKIEGFSDLHDATVIGLIDGIHIHNFYLMELLNGFEESSRDIGKLYDTSSDLSLVLIQLKVWNQQISLAGRNNLLQMIISSTESNLLECTSLIIKYHLSVIKSALVFDYHGNNWSDTKPFFEGERCSVTVQMWHFYMRGILYDVSKQLSDEVSREVIWTVSLEMLRFFVFRYSSIKPSYRRQKQVKADILYLLISFKWLLSHVVSNIDEFLNMDEKRTELWHLLCVQLLDVLVVTSAPLTDICTFLTHKVSTDAERPNIFWYNEVGTSSNMTNVLHIPYDNSFEIALDILAKKKFVDQNLLIRLLTEDKWNFAPLLVKNTVHLKKPTLIEKNSTELNVNSMFCGGVDISMDELTKEELLTQLIILFMRLPTSSFIHFMTVLIEEDSVNSFKVRHIEQLPVWFRVISNEFSPSLKRILTPAIEFLSVEESSFLKDLDKLPCSCPVFKSTAEKTSASLLRKCLVETLNTLVDSMVLLPSRLWDLLTHIKEQTRFTQSWITQSNLGTKVLACLLHNWLVTNLNMESFLHKEDALAKLKSKITVFAELLWHIIYHLTLETSNNPNLPLDIHLEIQNSGDVIESSLSKLNEYFNRKDSSSEFQTKVTTSDSLEENSPIFSEKENASLKFIFSIIKANQVTIKQIVQGKDTENPVNIETTKSRQTFNPLHHYKICGAEEFDHFQHLEGELQWNRLIPAVESDKWRVLLWNRFEFADDSGDILNEEERQMVEKIKDVERI